MRIADAEDHMGASRAQLAKSAIADLGTQLFKTPKVLRRRRTQKQIAVSEIFVFIGAGSYAAGRFPAR
jgi:hypothetical protein